MKGFLEGFPEGFAEGMRNYPSPFSLHPSLRSSPNPKSSGTYTRERATFGLGGAAR